MTTGPTTEPGLTDADHAWVDVHGQPWDNSEGQGDYCSVCDRTPDVHPPDRIFEEREAMSYLLRARLDYKAPRPTFIDDAEGDYLVTYSPLDAAPAAEPVPLTLDAGLRGALGQALDRMETAFAAFGPEMSADDREVVAQALWFGIAEAVDYLDSLDDEAASPDKGEPR